MWSTLSLLLLFGAVIGTSATECELYKLPKTGECQTTIIWKVRDDKEALATCLEYFPTTFVKGKKVGEHAHCTVTAAYTCVHLESDHPDVFLMFDKCYYFPKDKAGNYEKGTIAQYTAVSDPLCKGGKLSVFYSHTHAKFVGMKAHTLKIDKLWIGITSDGKTIEKENGEHKMMIKNLWKVVEGDYWNGNELKKVPSNGKGEYTYPADVKYFFMRTRTDYVMGRWQGSFERTNEKMKATFACEFESKFTAEQEWYCNKLPELGIDAVYDKDEKPAGAKILSKPRCLYVTANSYTFKDREDMKNIKGCQEKPSDLHSAGMDDGTANPKKYNELKNRGPLRLATGIVDKVANDKENKSGAKVQKKCQPLPDQATRLLLFQKWRHYDHHQTTPVRLSADSQIPWDDKYPKNECSDFPGKSSTMGVKSGKKIDMPPEVRAPAVCSLKFFQECENRNQPCGSKYVCTNVPEFQSNVDPKLAGFFTCTCPGEGEAYQMQSDKTCKWISKDNFCAWFHFFDGETGGMIKEGKEDIKYIEGQTLKDLGKDINDMLDRIVVRDGCKITIRSHEHWHHPNFELLENVGYGMHKVPNSYDGSLAGEWYGMGATSAQCTCK